MPDSSIHRQRLQLLTTIVVLAGAVWAIYGRAIDAPFVFDDLISIEKNHSITRLWPLVGDVTDPGPLNKTKYRPTSGRPLVNLSLAVNYHYGQLDPRGYHAFSIVVHVLSSILLAAMVRRTLELDSFGGRFDEAAWLLSLATALLWAVHPLQTESVIYATQRTELMMVLFYLATLYCSIRYWTVGSRASQIVWLALATVSCLAGMASKESMVTAPVVVLLYDRAFVSGSFRTALRRSAPLYGCLCLGWILLAALNYDGPRSDASGFHHQVPAYAWWLTQTGVLLMYLKLVVWPWPLVIHYASTYSTLAEAWPSLLAAAALAIGTLILLWKNKPSGFLAASAWLAISPTLVVPIISEVAAERRMYLPLAAIATFFVVGGYSLLERLAPGSRRSNDHAPRRLPVAAIVAPVLLASIGLSVVSVSRLAAYDTPLALWRDALKYEPDDVVVRNNLANILTAQGELQEALEHAHRSLQLDSDAPDAHNNYGGLLLALGQTQPAIDEFQIFLNSKPDSAEGRNNLGSALLAAGRYQDAIDQLEQALKIDPLLAQVHNNLGEARAALGQQEQAIREFQQALALKPDYAEAHDNLGLALIVTGHLEEALGHFQEAARLKPELAKAQYHLGATLVDLNRAPESVAPLQEATRLKPDYAKAWATLATAQARLNLRADAIAAAEKAIAMAQSQSLTKLAEQTESLLSTLRAGSVNPSDATPEPSLPPGP